MTRIILKKRKPGFPLKKYRIVINSAVKRSKFNVRSCSVTF
ncbi:Uncharacterized protein dnm_058150 [Desulfonema magnum]|uniref:Uncharacterized protein n=1 Tax=Desulfonema magnum TaxID=45655 RepID=A0A975GR79_9BACT|nr:Uncharacterized protein dnm_058150 [Desulfonema magnum]